MSMTTDKNARKERPITRGVLDYFPDAIAEVAHVSFIGNQQHNPGEEMHWSRGKSSDHADCVVRHLLDRGTIDDDGLLHTAKAAWRILALLQLELEQNQRCLNDLRKTIEEVEASAGDPTNTEPEQDNPISEAAEEVMDMIFGEGYMKHCRETILQRDLLVDRHENVKIRKEDADVPWVDTTLTDNTDPHKPVPRTVCNRWIYIAGPMRGCVDYNFPAFDAAKKFLEETGYRVISPADIDRREGLTNQRGYAKRDCKAILDHCDSIYMLKGWEKSVGATAEHAVAKWAGLEIHYQEKQ